MRYSTTGTQKLDQSKIAHFGDGARHERVEIVAVCVGAVLALKEEQRGIEQNHPRKGVHLARNVRGDDGRKQFGEPSTQERRQCDAEFVSEPKVRYTVEGGEDQICAVTAVLLLFGLFAFGV